MTNPTTVSIDEIIACETLISQNLMRARGTISQRQEISIRGVVAPNYQRPQEALMVPGEFISSPISADIYKLIAAEFRDTRPLAITDETIHESRLFTSNLTGVNLDRVRIEVVPSHEWDLGDTVEGFHIPVGYTDHMVFAPSVFSSPAELLVHELGHAAHTTAQRKNNELPFFFTTAITAEFVAHYCQYNYLLSQQTRSHFINALGQLNTASFALSIYASQVFDNFTEFLKTEHAKSITQALPISVIERTYWSFCADKPRFYHEALRGIAIVLALWLVDDHEGMKRFIASDRIDRTIDDKLEHAFPDTDYTKAFECVNEQIYKLLNRFNR
ncbi:TPA: hypothetical protein ACKRQV_000025 [Pseudomonas aeruginosa]|nr:hypothetical protein [Pseudomonas aeruginosa]EIU2863533.1 hypothetical protein [Pseudomonas aeruginosa]HEK3717299.1 hypothetical protein [Pseudomonas aeruginosa]